MSQQLAPEGAEPAGRPHRRRSSRFARLAALVTVGVVVAAVIVVTRHSGSHPARPLGSSAPAARPPTAEQRRAARAAAVEALLRRRSAAILHHDRRRLLATIDPTRSAFRADQARMLANLRRVPLAGWSYSVDPVGVEPDTPRLARYGVPTWAPRSVTLHYRIRGFDTRPTSLAQYPTFTRRHGRWYLASLDDFDHLDRVSATEIWDYEPVRVVRRPRVLVLGAPTEAATMVQVADQLHAAIPQVSAVWGTDWARRVVGVVPATEQQLARITGDHGNLDRIAALSSAEVRETGAPAPVGARISVNPVTWPALGSLGQQVVITHELTHVATRAQTGYRTPTWLVEGFADYVGFQSAGVATSVAAGELAARVRAGELPATLPSDRQFAGTNRNLSVAYETAWLACRFIADRFGQRRLVAFYRAVGTARSRPAVAVRHALRRVLALDPERFDAGWRDYVRRQLS